MIRKAILALAAAASLGAAALTASAAPAGAGFDNASYVAGCQVDTSTGQSYDYVNRCE